MSAGGNIAIMGEAMLELRHRADRTVELAYGGDTLNTAIYLARMGVKPFYVTAVGSDPYSNRMFWEWEDECVQTPHVLRHPDRHPGLYAIQTDDFGERSFYYWRDQSAARAFFETDGAEQALEFMASADWLYISGITLSIFKSPEQDRLIEIAAAVKSAGGQVVFDPNYRTRNWASDAQARDVIGRFCEYVTLGLPTIDDENQLFGPQSEADHAKRWHDLGVPLIFLKCGPNGVRIFELGQDEVHVQVAEAVHAIDTTGAGDSFNAAVIGALYSGADTLSAARAGNELAGTVIQHRGAIVPKAEMVQGSGNKTFRSKA